MADTLSDELLQQIAQSENRCYSHEGRAMAAELIEWREKAKAARAAAAANIVNPWNGIP